MSTKVSCPVLRGLGPSNGARPLGIVWLRHLLGWMVSAFSSREDLVLENRFCARICKDLAILAVLLLWPLSYPQPPSLGKCGNPRFVRVSKRCGNRGKVAF